MHTCLPLWLLQNTESIFCIKTLRCLVSLLWSLHFLLCILSSEFSHFPPKKQYMFSGHFYYSFPLTYLLFTDWDGGFVIFVSLAFVAHLCPFHLTNFGEISFYICGWGWKSDFFFNGPPQRIEYSNRAMQLNLTARHTPERDGEWLFCFYTLGSFSSYGKGR